MVVCVGVGWAEELGASGVITAWSPAVITNKCFLCVTRSL